METVFVKVVVDITRRWEVETEVELTKAEYEEYKKMYERNDYFLSDHLIDQIEVDISNQPDSEEIDVLDFEFVRMEE